MRQLSLLDKLLCEIDVGIRTLCRPTQRNSQRPNPAQNIPTNHLTTTEKKHVAGLMRVNHAGEVAAQALYQGQALTAKLTTVKTQMANAALEEIDHLAWCEERLNELNSSPSILNPIWYTGALLIGMLAGVIGDQWSLGFVAETERQVTTHLQKHLNHLPPQDEKTKAILAKMQEDETQHAKDAMAAGAIELPIVMKQLMHYIAKIMTNSSYYL